MDSDLRELLDAAISVRRSLYEHKESGNFGEIHYSDAMSDPIDSLVDALNNYQASQACNESVIDTNIAKRRYFFIHYVFGSNGKGVQWFDSSEHFNFDTVVNRIFANVCKQVSGVKKDSVMIMSWQELTKEDYEEFGREVDE